MTDDVKRDTNISAEEGKTNNSKLKLRIDTVSSSPLHDRPLSILVLISTLVSPHMGRERQLAGVQSPFLLRAFDRKGSSASGQVPQLEVTAGGDGPVQSRLAADG